MKKLMGEKLIDILNSKYEFVLNDERYSTIVPLGTPPFPSDSLDSQLANLDFQAKTSLIERRDVVTMSLLSDP